jgi:hypothetical protein
MGGHEIFLRLDETVAYDHCPGHRELRPIGSVRRDKDSVTVLRGEDSSPMLVVRFDGSRHSITWMYDGHTESLPQVNNPWRTWLPKILPEE